MTSMPLNPDTFVKINIVTEPSPGWILRRWSESYKKYLTGPMCDVVINTKPDKRADINLYINYFLYEGPQINTYDVCVFTHREDDAFLAKSFDDIASKCDLCLGMSDYTMGLLPKGSKRIHIPPHDQFLNDIPVNVGIVGRTYSSGRKNEDWVSKLRELCGNKINIMSTYDDPIPFNEMPNFYSNLDYLLVIANKEGGPMPLLEAMSMNTPVIAPNVGLAWEYPVIRYEGFDDLVNVLKNLKPFTKNAWQKAGLEMENILLTLMFD